MKTQVLVVGAGPVGLTMAAELARYGVAVRIVDKAAQRTDKSKALAIWSRTLELLDRAGCASPLVEAGLKVTAANIVAGDEQLARITLDGVATSHPYALMLPQSETERLLEEHLGRLGVSVERSVELLEFTDTGNEVSAKLRAADGGEESLEAAWLIGCDGAHSTVRHGLGFEFVGDTLQSDWILADLHMAGVTAPGEIHIGLHGDGMLAFFPIVDDRYRVIADVGTGKPHRPDPTLREVQEVIDKRGPGGVVVSNPIWLASFHINERKVNDYRKGRVFLAGDAAHIHSPAGGQGMNTGIQDACNLAWKLALVLHGMAAAEPLLGSYSTERGAVGEEVLKHAGTLTRFGILHGSVLQTIRNHIASLVLGARAARQTVAETLTELSIGYSKSSLNGADHHVHGGPKVGARAPVLQVEPPVGSGNSPRFAIFGDAGEGSARVFADHQNFLEKQLRKPFLSGGLWLVRPDGYVALAIKEGGWSEVDAYLTALGSGH